MGNVIFALIMFGIVAAILVMAARNMRIQHEGAIGLVEAWGRYSRVLIPGRTLLWPWERVVADLPLQIFEWETPPQKLMLKGGAPLTLSAIVYYQIEHAHRTPGAPRPARIIGSQPAPIGSPALATAPAGRALAGAAPMQAHSRAGLGIDSLEPGARSQLQRRPSPAPPTRLASAPTMFARILGRSNDQLDIAQAAYRAHYLVEDWKEATQKEALAVMQQVFSKVGVADDIIGNVEWHEVLGERVREHLQEKTERWGVQIIDVALKDVAFAEMTLANLTAEARADREGRVRSKEAENYQHIAEMLHLSPEELLRWRQVEVMRELAKSPQPRVMFTTDIAGHAFADQPSTQAALAGPGNPAPATGGSAPPSAPNVRGYLGSEPPAPALLPSTAADRGGPPSAGPGGMIAPTLQNVDQQ